MVQNLFSCVVLGCFVLELLYFYKYFEGMVRVACSMLYPIFGFWWGYCIFVVFVIVFLTICVEWNKKGIDLMSMPFYCCFVVIRCRGLYTS